MKSPKLNAAKEIFLIVILRRANYDPDEKAGFVGTEIEICTSIPLLRTNGWLDVCRTRRDRAQKWVPTATTCHHLHITVHSPTKLWGGESTFFIFTNEETDEESIFTPVTQLIWSGHRDILWAPLCTTALAVGRMTHTTAPGLGERKAPSLSFQHLTASETQSYKGQNRQKKTPASLTATW